jgi:hypothetical protein
MPAARNDSAPPADAVTTHYECRRYVPPIIPCQLAKA